MIMRLAEENTSYVYSHSYKEQIFYGFRKVGEISDSGYNDETYSIAATYVVSEPAGWAGHNPNRFDGDVQILNKEYDRLKNFVEKSKLAIVESLKKASRTRTRDLKVGDYVFSYLPADEYDDYDYDSFDCYRILEISDNGYKVLDILCISRYTLDFAERVQEFREDYELEWITEALLLDEAQFLKAKTDAISIRDKIAEMVKKLL